VGRHFSVHTEAGRHWPRAWNATPKGETLSDYRNLLEPHSANLFGALPVAVMSRT
jgi:hypothetical protein